eukprot:SAG11_NODE_575_length_8420_cov_2.398149_6_plen_167_part_00
MLTDFLIREMGMKGRLHVHSSLQDHGFCFRIRWPFIVFGCLLTIADIIFQTTATCEFSGIRMDSTACAPVLSHMQLSDRSPTFNCGTHRPLAVQVGVEPSARVQSCPEDGQECGEFVAFVQDATDEIYILRRTHLIWKLGEGCGVHYVCVASLCIRISAGRRDDQG